MTSFYRFILIALVFTHSSDPFSHYQIPKFGRTILGNSAMQHHTIARHVMTRYTTKVKSYNCFEIGFSLTSKRFSLADIPQKVVVIRLVLRVIFRHQFNFFFLLLRQTSGNFCHFSQDVSFISHNLTFIPGIKIGYIYIYIYI